jgi:hypothetical protein
MSVCVVYLLHAAMHSRTQPPRHCSVHVVRVVVYQQEQVHCAGYRPQAPLRTYFTLWAQSDGRNKAKSGLFG